MVFHRPQAREIEKEISFTPGRLANKLGIGKSTLKKHLEASGLIEECFYDEHGWLRIPYSTACKIAPPEAVATKRERRPRKRTVSKKDLTARLFEGTNIGESKGIVRSDPEKTRADEMNQYQLLAQALTRSGVTIKDLMEWHTQRGSQPEQTQERQDSAP